MANRPRLPNVDPEDLAKLANQYPGSGPSTAPSAGSAEGATDSASSTTTTPGSRPGGLGTRPSTTDRTATGATTTTASPSDRVAPPAPAAARRRGGWFTTFLTFLFTVLAVVAALAALGAPSYRAEIRDLLKANVPQLEPEVVDRLTGFEPDRMEITFDALDARVSALTEAIARVAAVENVASDDVRELLLRDDLAVKLDGLTAQLTALTSQVETMGGEAGAQADRLTALEGNLAETAERLDAGLTENSQRLGAEIAASTERLGSEIAATSERLDAGLAAAVETLRGEMSTRLEGLGGELAETSAALREALTAVQGEVATVREEAGALGDRMAASEARGDGFEAADSALAERLAALDTRLDDLGSDLATLVTLAREIDRTVSTYRGENMPILAVIQLRDAIARSEPYGPELAFAKKVLNGAPGIDAALARLDESAMDGIASVPILQRDLRLIANEFGTFVTQVETWSDRVSGWFTALFGSTVVPEARQGGGIVAAIATIDDALERGDLELAIREGVAIQTERRSTALANWLNAVVQRSEVTQAVGKLEEVVYARATAE